MLGFGGQGIVQKFNHSHKNRSVVLARKRLYNRRLNLDILREEPNVLEKLRHDHIVRLVGTYCYQHCELYLVMWPAATCDLSELLGDLDDLRFNAGDRADILGRLDRLDLDDTSAVDNSLHTTSKGSCPLNYLRRIMGCVTGAVDYCHTKSIRHLDLKPQNILLSPGRVYLADFGISRDVNDQDHTSTFLENGSLKWLSPERLSPQSKWTMQAADVYSLGLVFLNIATILYGGRQSHLFDVLEQKSPPLRLQQLDRYMDELQKLALVMQEFADESAHTFAPKHVVSLTRRMMSREPPSRPGMAKVNQDLVELGGLEQIYHNTCCKAHPRSLTQLLDRKYAHVCDERKRLAEEKDLMMKRLEVLEGSKETFSARLERERKEHARDRENLSRRLEEKQQHIEQLEARLREPDKRHRPKLRTPERSTSGGLMMKSTRQPPKSPSRQFAKPTLPAPAPVVNTKPLYYTQPSPPSNNRRPEPEVRKSSDSLTTIHLRSLGSASRLPQPVNPSTPIRSGTPRDPNLTSSTTESMTSSLFSRSSRQTTGSGLSPATTNSSPSASKILLETDKRISGNDDTGRLADSASYFSNDKPALGTGSKSNAIDAES
jgi:serine/threonine protein kinase